MGQPGIFRLHRRLDLAGLVAVEGLHHLEGTATHRVEGLRGGPSPIYSNGQPGVTVNFIQKKGEDTPEGLVRLTVGTDDLRRVDFYSGGPLGTDTGWYYSVGGFYRETDGVRQTGFPVEKGGQLSATLTKRWAEGEFTLYARHTDDKNTFYTAVPLVSRNNGQDISSFPGLDATTGTLVGDDFRRVTLPILMPGVIAGMMLAFVVSLDDVVITEFVKSAGQDTLPTYMLGQMRRQLTPEINAISTGLLVLTVVLLTAFFLLTRDKEKT